MVLGAVEAGIRQGFKMSQQAVLSSADMHGHLETVDG
jgi:hypothetical protein